MQTIIFRKDKYGKVRYEIIIIFFKFAKVGVLIVKRCKPFKQFPAFKESKPFSKINSKLLEWDKTPINW